MKGSLLLYNLKLNCLIFLYQSKQLTDYIYTNIYCKLLKCIGQTQCSYEHYFVKNKNLPFVKTKNRNDLNVQIKNSP